MTKNDIELTRRMNRAMQGPRHPIAPDSVWFDRVLTAGEIRKVYQRGRK